MWNWNWIWSIWCGIDQMELSGIGINKMELTPCLTPVMKHVPCWWKCLNTCHWYMPLYITILTSFTSSEFVCMQDNKHINIFNTSRHAKKTHTLTVHYTPKAIREGVTPLYWRSSGTNLFFVLEHQKELQ